MGSRSAFRQAAFRPYIFNNSVSIYINDFDRSRRRAAQTGHFGFMRLSLSTSLKGSPLTHAAHNGIDSRALTVVPRCV
jgi:hypothetical protein